MNSIFHDKEKSLVYYKSFMSQHQLIHQSKEILLFALFVNINSKKPKSDFQIPVFKASKEQVIMKCGELRGNLKVIRTSTSLFICKRHCPDSHKQLPTLTPTQAKIIIKKKCKKNKKIEWLISVSFTFNY